LAFDRGVEQRLILDDAAELDAAGSRQDHSRLRVIDACRQLVRGKAAEHNRMDRADAGAGEHRKRRFRHHRHVDQHAVALRNAQARQYTGQARDLIAEFVVGEEPDLSGDRAVPDQCDAIAPSCRDMTVECVPARIEPSASEPPVKRRPARVEHLIPAPIPIDDLRCLRPEFLRPLERAAVGFGIARHWFPPSALPILHQFDGFPAASRRGQPHPARIRAM
jgi:hypothetical protein